MIVSKVDAIVIAPADSKALVPVIKKAVDAGIIVVNIDNRLDPDVLKSKDLNVPFVGPDNRKGAKKVGDYLAKYLKSGDEVGIIEGVSTTTNAQQRTAGFKDAMQAGGMKVVALQSGEWEIDKGNAVARPDAEREPEREGAAVRQRQHGDRRGLGRARGRQGRQGAGGRLRQHQRDQADARRTAACWPLPTSTPPSRPCSASTRRLKAIAEHKKQSELSGVVETPVDLVTK